MKVLLWYCLLGFSCILAASAADSEEVNLEDNPELTETHDENTWSEDSTDPSEDNLPSDADVSHDPEESPADDPAEEGESSTDDPADDLDATDYSELSEDEIKQRFQALHKHMDANGDGKVSEEELQAWSAKRREKQDNEDMHHTFTSRDTDSDGSISWPEYVSHMYGYTEKELEDLEKNAGKDKENDAFLKKLKQEKEAFDKADANHDKVLNAEEHLAFERPKHFAYMVDFLKEAFDKNNDSRIDAAEFAATQKGEEEFKKLDVGKDGSLNDDELLLWSLSSGPVDYSAHEAKKWIAEADNNKDNVLEVDELLQHRESWAPSAHSHHEASLQSKEEL